MENPKIDSVSFCAKPMSRRDVIECANSSIKEWHPTALNEAAFFPVADFIEFDMKEHLGFDYHVQDLDSGIEAFMDPEDALIVFDSSVYDNLLDNDPRARFTACHELGHAVLHKSLMKLMVNISPQSLKRASKINIEPFRDPEWQANVFAAQILMPECHVIRMINNGHTVEDVKAIFGVSYSAASIAVDRAKKQTPLCANTTGFNS